jgi:hypothetical protein
VVVIVILVGVFAVVVGSMYLYPASSVQVPLACKDATMIGSDATTYGNLIHTSFLLTQSNTTIPLQFVRQDYVIPQIGSSVLLTSDAKTAVVVMIDLNNTNFNSTIYLVNKSDNSTVTKLSFANDFLAATIRNNVLYIYNGGLGYFLNPSSGEPVNKIVSMDNYRDVLVTGHGAIIQTTAIIAGLYSDGSFFEQPSLNFSAIAYGCFIS